MLLAELLKSIEIEGHIPPISISNISQDSRAIMPGDLFVSIPCMNDKAFLKQAIDRGAKVVVGSQETIDFATEKYSNILGFAVGNPRLALAKIAATFYEKQPDVNVAVTGTNGKSSIVHFLRQIYSQLGRKAASLGTLGIVLPDDIDLPPLLALPKLTTPDAISLHKVLGELKNIGISHVAFEASSHGLDQCRLHGVKLTAAVFTNLSQDHLDYHGTMEEYFKAKAKLFTEVLPADGTAIVNLDSEVSGRLLEAIKIRGQNVITYGYHPGSNLRIENVVLLGNKITFDLCVQGAKFEGLTLNVAGAFQVENVIAAVGLALSTGEEPAAILEALPGLKGPKGRMDYIGATNCGADVYVDFGHTPEALQRALESLRQHTKGQLHIVFGCGGDRDHDKRAQMGQIADSLADNVYVTDDNPRYEEPAAIRSQVMAGCPSAQEIGGREQAILTAIDNLKPGDVLLVAGKGHETGQIIKDKVIPFDDKTVIQSYLGQNRQKLNVE